MTDGNALPTPCGPTASAPRVEPPKAHVGIFQAHWALQVHTVNAVRVLADSGFNVDLFLYRVPEVYAEERLDQIPGVRIKRLDGPEVPRSRQPVPDESMRAETKLNASRPANQRSAAVRALRNIGKRVRLQFVRCYPARLAPRNGGVPERVLRATREAMNGRPYRALIGVEKAGLVWAGTIGQQQRIPYLYHSLELYTRETYGRVMPIRKKWLKHAEEKYHRRAYATIVQDKARADVLFADNRVRPGRVLHVPVSLLGTAYETRTSFLQERFGLPSDQVVILQVGLLNRDGIGLELVRAAQSFPRNWTLVLHGHPARPDDIPQLQAADTGHRVALSTTPVPRPDLPNVVCSAHIGLVLYSYAKITDRLSAFSSEKLALCLQCGVPVIAFDYPGYEILEREECGVTVRDYSELPAAIERVLASRERLSRNARTCFARYYEFRANYRKVVEFLQAIPGAGANRPPPATAGSRP